jgi:TATA-box binding protein (TBP) (component of TFIID and TFIIIB)
MSDIKIPTEPPALDPLKLVTMTISSNINQYFNLDVLSRYTTLDSNIVGIHYRDVHRGQGTTVDQEPDAADQDEDPTSGKSGRFKNQCTFVINDGNKIINTKLFNNGKMVNVGCKSPDQAIFTATTLMGKFTGMKGCVNYIISKTIKSKSNKELKKFFKDDLRKKFGHLIQLLVCHLDFTTNLECFDPSLSADESFATFTETCETDSQFVKDILYLYTIINILKCYYCESSLTDVFGEPAFQSMLSAIIENTDREQGVISYEFPAYISSSGSSPALESLTDSVLNFNESTVRTVLINKSTKCGYFINRTELQILLEQQPEIVMCKFDKSKYPGVLAHFKTSEDKVIKIIIFNTGKINITAARTHSQVQEGYDFISRICTDYFDQLLLRCEYQNKKKEYEDSLPNQHFVGVINDQSYYLLNKSRILANPRNVRCLHSLGLLDKYR